MSKAEEGLPRNKGGGIMQDSKTNVGNGKAYAVCTCDGPESESKSKCAFKTQDLAQAAVACDEGYTVKVGVCNVAFDSSEQLETYQSPILVTPLLIRKYEACMLMIRRMLCLNRGPRRLAIPMSAVIVSKITVERQGLLCFYGSCAQY